VTNPFYEPFRGIVASRALTASHSGDAAGDCVIVYLLLHLAINGVLRIIAHRKTTSKPREIICLTN